MDLREVDRVFYRDGYRLAHQHLDAEITASRIRKGIAQLYEAVDELLEAFLKRSASEGKAAECRKGCSWCCHQPVFAVTHEFFFVQHHILMHFEVQKQKQLLENAREKVMKTHNKSLQELMLVKSPCPFLDSGACSIYPARPMACRIYLSASERACKREFDEPADDRFPDLFEFPLRAGRMLNEGFVAYLKQMGFKHSELPLEQGYSTLLSMGQTMEGWIEHRSDRG